MADPKKILLFSTLNPYPFWAGSENLWFDFVTDERISADLKFQVCLADSSVTRKKALQLSTVGIKPELYKHFNTSFTKRNIYRIKDKLNRRHNRTLPWYDKIKKRNCDLLWINVAGLGDLKELAYPVELCKKSDIPYWLILQHGYENFFLGSEEELVKVTEIACSAKRFIFISQRNCSTLERAIGQKLKNAFHSVNALPAQRVIEAAEISKHYPISEKGTARFFNLGRFSPADKAQYLILQAFANDQWKNRDWELSFIGVSDFGKLYLKKLVEYYALDSNKIKIQAYTENIFKEIVQHDVLFMPSLSEGTPFAMVESMACGRPAIGTPIGGIPELILENKTGWLADTTDIKDISKKLEQAWQERSKWKEFGQYAQKHVEENYNQEKSFVELFQTLNMDIKL